MLEEFAFSRKKWFLLPEENFHFKTSRVNGFRNVHALFFHSEYTRTTSAKTLRYEKFNNIHINLFFFSLCILSWYLALLLRVCVLRLKNRILFGRKTFLLSRIFASGDWNVFKYFYTITSWNCESKKKGSSLESETFTIYKRESKYYLFKKNAGTGKSTRIKDNL